MHSAAASKPRRLPARLGRYDSAGAAYIELSNCALLEGGRRDARCSLLRLQRGKPAGLWSHHKVMRRDDADFWQAEQWANTINAVKAGQDAGAVLPKQPLSFCRHGPSLTDGTAQLLGRACLLTVGAGQAQADLGDPSSLPAALVGIHTVIDCATARPEESTSKVDWDGKVSSRAAACRDIPVDWVEKMFPREAGQNEENTMYTVAFLMRLLAV